MSATTKLDMSPAPRSLLSRNKALPVLFLVLGLVIGTIASLDSLAFHAKPSLDSHPTGRWAYSEWRTKEKVYEKWSGPGGAPEILIVGDSSIGLGVRASILGPKAFNLGRRGLQAIELPELSKRMELMGIEHPKLIVVSILPVHFRNTESDRTLLDRPSRGLGWVLRHYYDQINGSQLALLPGCRVGKFHVEAQLARFDGGGDWTMDTDGTLFYLYNHIGPDGSYTDPGFIKEGAGFLTESKMKPLDDFAKLWEARGAKVVFLFTPLYPRYQPVYESQFPADLKLYRSEIDRIFHGQVLHMEGTMPESDYCDSLHLNKGGATAFTQILKARLAPYLDGTAPVTKP